ARLFDEPAQIRNPGLGGERRLASVVAEDPEQATHLRERLAAGLLDREEWRAGPCGLLVEEKPGGAGLDGHDADAVGNHVVELARDPRPLFSDRRPRPLLAL